MAELAPDAFLEWDDFVEKSPQGTVFAKSFWLRGFEQLAPGNKARVFVMREADGSIQAGMPLFVQRLGRRTVIQAPPLTAYSSLLLGARSRKDENREAEWEMNAISGLLAEVEPLKLDGMAFSHAPALTDVREFAWQGWATTPRYTYVKRLEDVDLEASLSKTHGKSFRKAQRAGYGVAAVEKLDERLDAFLKMFLYSYKTIPACYSRDCHLIRTLLQAGAGKGTALLYEARDAQGDVQAARIVWLSCQARVMDWAAATTDAGRSDGATVFLMTKMFEDLRARGYRDFDFCGANTRSIAQFKAGFNATLTSYYGTEKSKPSLFGAAKNVMRVLASVVRGRR